MHRLGKDMAFQLSFLYHSFIHVINIYCDIITGQRNDTLLLYTFILGRHSVNKETNGPVNIDSKCLEDSF